MLSWLKDILGDNYTEDIEKKISQEIGKNFVAKADFNAKNDALKNLEAQVRERDTQLETLKKSTGDAAALQEQIATLQTQNAEAKKTYEAELARVRLDGAVEAALTAAGAKNNTAVKALLADFLKDANRRHYYAHLQSIAVSKGQSVSVGTQIGVMGNTGNSFGAHLHYEVRTGQTTATRVNPADYCGVQNAKGTYTEQKTETAIGIYYPKEDLNVRTGAGVGYAVAEKDGAKYNTAYPVYEIKRVGTQDWGRIGTNRWICLAYCSTKPIAADNTAHKGTAYTMTCDMLKVRKSPSTLSKQVGQYSRGEIFYVIAQKGNWCQLESGNWMCAGKYLKKV